MEFEDVFGLKYVYLLCFFYDFISFIRFSLIFINVQVRRRFTHLTTEGKAFVEAFI